MTMLRKAIIAVGDQPLVSRFVRSSSVARGVVNRFVAGETLDTATAAALSLQQEGLTATLDQLGEDIASPEQASEAVASYIGILQRLSESGLEPNISIKLTMLGLDFDEQLVLANLRSILEAAQRVSGFVRVDMEGSAHTEATMNVFATLHSEFPDQVGIVIQTYLKRAESDVRNMIERRARVRLVKGAYAEPEKVAFQQMSDIRTNFVTLAKLLLDQGYYPAIATHDSGLIETTSRYAAEQGYQSERYEFQMLYGVRREEQRRIAERGQRMRIYVPFGTEWYPYFTRRIAERPANALFVLKNLRG